MKLEYLQDGVCPVRSVGQQTQVREWLLRTARLALELGELVAELYEQLAVALALVGRQGEDARHVVVLAALLLLGEVAHDVVAAVVHLAHHVEEEGVRVVVERLVVQEELGQQAQVLGVVLVLASVYLEEGNGVFPVDLIARWVLVNALGEMPLQTCSGFEELETKFANINAVRIGQLLRVRREIPVKQIKLYLQTTISK